MAHQLSACDCVTPCSSNASGDSMFTYSFLSGSSGSSVAFVNTSRSGIVRRSGRPAMSIEGQAVATSACKVSASHSVPLLGCPFCRSANDLPATCRWSRGSSDCGRLRCVSRKEEEAARSCGPAVGLRRTGCVASRNHRAGNWPDRRRRARWRGASAGPRRPSWRDRYCWPAPRQERAERQGYADRAYSLSSAAQKPLRQGSLSLR